MAFPSKLSTTSTAFSTAATAHVANHPATVNSGDLLISRCGWQPDVTTATPTGWSERFDAANAGEVAAACYVRKADGTEGGGTTDFVTSANAKGSVQIDRYAAGTWRDSGTILNDIEFATFTSTSANPDPPALNPAGWDVEDTGWIAGEVNRNLEQVSAGPTNYTGLVNSGSTGGANGSNAQQGAAFRDNAVASEDPGTFTNSQSRTYVSYTIAIRPALGGAFSLVVDPGSYAITGVAATILAAHLLEALAGGYVLTGAAAELVFGALGGAFSLSLDPGIYAIVGKSATFFLEVPRLRDPEHEVWVAIGPALGGAGHAEYVGRPAKPWRGRR